MQIPNENREFLQPNDGEVSGNLYATYGIDLLSNRGKIRLSSGVIKAIDTTDTSHMDGYVAQFSKHGVRYMGISDDMFLATNPFGTWYEDTNSGNPAVGNTVTDMVYFNGLTLVADSDDIIAWDGSSWSSWWKGTLGKASLILGNRHLLWVGPDGNLYITDDNSTKVYRVDPSGTVITTGAGTLDYSATQYILYSRTTTSNRSWIGTMHDDDGEAVIIEWDMSPEANSANKLHPIGSTAVLCMMTWNDTPIAVLRNGNIKYHNGSSFVDWPNAKFPAANTNKLLDDRFVHHNGGAVIDGLPHFLVKGQVLTDSNDTYLNTGSSLWNMGSGVYCLDPKIGLYNRFPISSGSGSDYQQMSLQDVGALYPLNSEQSKFICSYQYYIDDGYRSVIAYHDNTGSEASHGYFASTFADSFKDALQGTALYHKKLKAGEKIRLWYRTENENGIQLDGTWANTTTFNTTDDASNVQVGDMVMVKVGNGAGQITRVSAIEPSALTYQITLEEANAHVTSGDTAIIEVLNFKRFGEITDTGLSEHTFDFPTIEIHRKVQVLVELYQNAGNVMEVDYCIIN